MKRFFKICFAVFFFAACVFPVYTMPFSSSDPPGAPSLISEGRINGDFAAQTDAYLSENFSFRENLIDALAHAETALFHTSPEEQVIEGKRGWLYFSETLDDYTGNRRLSEREINELSLTLELISEYVKNNGADFLFFCAPNKNSVYPQYMPRRYKRGDENTNLNRLSARLDGKEWYINLLPPLREQSGQTYHKRDTHWNNRGALTAYGAAMSALNLPAKDIAADGEKTVRDWKGDLGEMLFPKTEKFDFQVRYNYKFNYKITSRYRSEEDLNISASCGEGDGSLLMFRDSFTNALLPYFAESFAKSEFTRVVPYRLNTLESGGISAVIIETAERNLKNIIESAPIMPAPEREGITAAQPTAPSGVKVERRSDTDHIYGVLPVGSAKHIYISRGGRFYEAFPVYEKDLPEDRGENETGFSAYLPRGSGEITLYCER